MRKAIIATILTLTLTLAATATATAAPTPRAGDRDRDTPFTRIVRVIKHIITAGAPTVPIP